jgi:hypothetical protein
MSSGVLRLAATASRGDRVRTLAVVLTNWRRVRTVAPRRTTST